MWAMDCDGYGDRRNRERVRGFGIPFGGELDLASLCGPFKEEGAVGMDRAYCSLLYCARPTMRLFLAVVSDRIGQLFHGADGARAVLSKNFVLIGVSEIMWHPQKSIAP